MSLSGILLGIVNIGIVVLVLLLVGACILWFCSYLNFAVPIMVQRLYIGLVALIALYMLVALLLGMPTWRIVDAPFREQAKPSAAIAAVSEAATADHA